LIAAVAGLWLLRRQASWREVVLLSWIVIPLLALQIWPVKGFQYLLPTAPAVAILAGRLLSRVGQVLPGTIRRGRPWIQAAAIAAVVASLLVPSINRVATRNSATFLAGSGGLPAGRQAGQWLSSHVPAGAVLLTIGPSMANVLEYYGHRQAYALSISPNPLHRNPSYAAVNNPDRALRDDDIQYVVWDAYSAARTKHFAAALLHLAHRYHGRVVHAEEIVVHGAPTAVIVIYAVRP
jgi:4-amino-4-deoxy-L-arabinose transferase-like glycosyltransferase